VGAVSTILIVVNAQEEILHQTPIYLLAIGKEDGLKVEVEVEVKSLMMRAKQGPGGGRGQRQFQRGSSRERN